MRIICAMKHKTNLTLEDGTRDWLRRVAAERGVSQSAIVDELVEIAAAARPAADDG